VTAREPLAEPKLRPPGLAVYLPAWIGLLPVAEIVKLRDWIRAKRVAKALPNGRRE
jgi:hypothetical protein